MSNNKIYWRGTEELEKDAAFVKNSQREFSEELPIDQFLGKKELDSTNTSRRDFLKFMGFGITAATLAACETPVVKSLPYVVKPNEVMPGIANYYASTYFDGFDYASILVKTREGRPIHIEGNKLSSVTKGGVSARVNSSVLSLYDTKRYQNPMKDGAATDWATADSEIKSALESARMSGGNVRILSSTMISPSSLALISEMKAWVEGGEAGATLNHVMYDAVSASGMLEANKRTHGKAVIPSYRFDMAKAVVSINADFLINWINPLDFASGYGKMRNPETGMSRHYQFESTLTTTGSNADVRGAIKPSEQGAVAVMLYNAIASMIGGSSVGSASLVNDDNNVASKVSEAAKDLWANKGKAIVVCGSNDPNVQVVVNGINEMLGSYGSTIDMNKTINLRKGSDAAVATLIGEMNSGSVSTLMVMDCDPAYTMPASWGFADALANVTNRVSFAEKPDMTSALCNYVLPVGHYLEQWNDANAEGDEVTFTQPAINKIYNTRQWQDSFMAWMGKNGSYDDYMKSRWNGAATMAEDPSVIFASRWNKYIHDGVGSIAAVMAAAPAESAAAPAPVAPADQASEMTSSPVASAASAIAGASEGWEVDFYVKTGIGTGINGDNPWLQELPDPVTKVVWDHYATMNPKDMEAEGLNTMMGEQQKAGMIRVNVGDQSMELPVVALPGQKRGTIGVALGYGKAKVTEEGVERTIGSNAFAVLPVVNGYVQYSAPCTYDKLEMRYNLASTQSSHTMMGRKILNETSLDTFKSGGKDVWNPVITIADSYGKQRVVEDLDLWNEHAIDLGHRWGLSIDLNTCIGCGACVTACHSENNVPIVGKDEVNRMRTMSWLRIDRYYSSDADPELHGDINQAKDYHAMEVPSEYPEVGFMPVMCQHCNHAPCETVCPVAATTHSDEGFNQMAYNRCIGTRYCANNCPYKVRRFNWFNYVADPKFTNLNPAQDDLARMVLNPDVVVRSRGVMEKCSMCVQRVQAGKLAAKKAGEPVADGAIQTACAASCPTNAITFGDINDKGSKVRNDAQNDRAYHLLEEVGVKPNVWYQTKVRNSIETAAEQTA
ncbi:MAG: TAT-variant-translocated molybdopterin oxidoreductase [Flavobacteriales bacterium]